MVQTYTPDGTEVRQGCDYCKVVSHYSCKGHDGEYGGFCLSCFKAERQCQWTPVGFKLPSKDELKGVVAYTPDKVIIVPQKPSTHEIERAVREAPKTKGSSNRRPNRDDDSMSPPPALKPSKRTTTTKAPEFQLPRNHSVQEPVVHGRHQEEPSLVAQSSSKRAADLPAPTGDRKLKKLRLSVKKQADARPSSSRRVADNTGVDNASDREAYRHVRDGREEAARVDARRRRPELSSLPSEQQLESRAVKNDDQIRNHKTDDEPRRELKRRDVYAHRNPPAGDSDSGHPADGQVRVAKKAKRVVESDDDEDMDDDGAGRSASPLSSLSPPSSMSPSSSQEKMDDDDAIARRLDEKYPGDHASARKKKQEQIDEKPRIKVVGRYQDNQAKDETSAKKRVDDTEPRMPLKKRLVDDGMATPSGSANGGESDSQSKRMKKVAAPPPRKDALQNLFASVAAPTSSPAADNKRPNAKLPIADATRKREEAIKKREEIYSSQPILDIMVPAALIRQFEKQRNHFKGHCGLQSERTGEIIGEILKMTRSS